MLKIREKNNLKKTILFICNDIPSSNYINDLRLVNLMSSLSSDYKLNLLYLSKKGKNKDVANFNKKLSNIKLFSQNDFTDLSWKIKLLLRFKNIFSLKPFFIKKYFYQNYLLKNCLKLLLKKNTFDYIIVSHFALTPILSRVNINSKKIINVSGIDSLNGSNAIWKHKKELFDSIKLNDACYSYFSKDLILAKKLKFTNNKLILDLIDIKQFPFKKFIELKTLLIQIDSSNRINRNLLKTFCR
jgi:hypothetical protein